MLKGITPKNLEKDSKPVKLIGIAKRKLNPCLYQLKEGIMKARIWTHIRNIFKKL